MVLPTSVGEPQVVEGLRLALTTFLATVSGKASKLDQPCLCGMQLQSELAKPRG